jgi:uncharacterized membrane protein
MKRIKSIDAIRGFCIFLMILGHLLDWWLKYEDQWLKVIFFALLEPLAASGFLFVSGFSTTLSYKSRVIKAENSNGLTMRKIKNEYFIRALLILIIALIYNTFIAFPRNDLTLIWSWNVLQTIAVSLLLTWPLLKTSKTFRIVLGIVLLVADQCILRLLTSYMGQPNMYGLFYYILFNPIEQFIILSFFSVFLIGTVVGDVFFEINKINNQEARKHAIKYVFIKFSLLIGIILMIFGAIFSFPDFFFHGTFSSMLYSIGTVLVLLSILLFNEEFEIVKTKKSYRFFYYFSFYSFTIYLAHNPLYFLFFRQLNALTIWIALVGVFIFLTLLLKGIYKKWGRNASLKVVISILSSKLANKLEVKFKISE